MTNSIKFTKKALILILALITVLLTVPLSALANGTETTKGYVYLSVSDDGQFISSSDGSPMAYTAVPIDELTKVDLDKYGLTDYKYDQDGDGKYEITALHLYVYAHEMLFGLSFNDVTVSGGAGSIYFVGGLFGFSDENLRYNYNGAYPANEMGWGITADQLVLSDGDFLDVAHFSDWMFYADSAYGFHYFTDENNCITTGYTLDAGATLSVNLIRVGGGMGMGDTTVYETDYTVYYGSSIGNSLGELTTDESGMATLTFSDAGTYYVWCDGGEGIDMSPGAIVSSPACAKINVASTAPVPQDVTPVLNAALAKLATTVTAPEFGTSAGEWTVFALARGGYFEKDDPYFTDYYNRIVATVNKTAASVNMNGALHKNKSTENSRLIVALSAIGKDATSVGDWNLVEAYSSNGFNWIKKQGINGTIWALIALDSNKYETTDPTLRQQCVDAIVAAQHNDGGWALQANKEYVSDPDVTSMALQALYNYRDQEAVAAACERAFDCLSKIQHENGTFASGGSECSESCAWVIVACSTWGINPDTDERFVKNGNSVVDGLLSHYLETESQFEHTVGAGANGMATDQSCYALVAYDRLLKGKTGLYDYSDVTFETPEPAKHSYTATVTAPTCTEEGYTTYSCTTCPHVYVSDELPALDHDYISTVTAPSCTETGYTTHTCSRCEYTYTDSETNALGHDHNSTVTAPTCTETGYTSHTCSRCEDTYTDSETNALGHSAGDWVIEKEATVGVAGSKYKPCSVCGERLESATVDALPEENGNENENDGDTNGNEKQPTTSHLPVIIITLAIIAVAVISVTVLVRRKNSK